MVAKVMAVVLGLVDAAMTPAKPRTFTGQDAAALVDRYGFKLAAAYLLEAQR